MASSSGSDNASTEKRSSKDKKNNKRGTSSFNPNRTENDFVPPVFSSDVIPHPASDTVITGFGTIKLTDSMCLVVDLPIHGAQLHPTHKDGSTDDQVQKGDSNEVLKEKAAQGKEIVAKQQKEAQVEDKILFMAKRLRYVFGDGSRTYTPRKRLCDVFGDGSRRSAVGEPIPIKRPTKIGNVAYNEKDQVPTENDIHPHHQILIGNEMQSNPNSSNSRSPGIRLTVDLPIGGAQLHPHLVSNKDISTNDQAQKAEREKILEEKAKKEEEQEKEVALATVAIAKQQKKAEIKENIRGSPGIRLTVDLPIGGAQLQPPLVSNKDISTNDQAQKGKREKILEEKAKNEAAQKKDVTQEKEVALVVVAIAKQQKKAEIKENIQGSPGIRLAADLPIGGAQLQPPLVSNKEISTNDQRQKGKREKILEEKAKKEAAQKKDAAQEKEVALAAVAIAKQQKKAEIKENIRGSPGIRLTVDLPIGGAQLQLPLVSNKEISTNDQAQKGEREKILQEKAKKEATQKKDATQEKEVALAAVAIAKQQKKAEIKENIRGSPGIRLTVDLPIGGAQLQLPLVSNKEISTNDQAQKGEREKILQEKAKKEAAQKKDATQEKEVALATVAIAKQQKKAEIKENIRGSPGIRLTVDLPIGGAQLQLPLVSNKEISTNDQAQKGEREKILQEKAKKEAAQKKDAAQEKEVALAAVAIAKQQKKAEIKENIRGSPGIRLTVDLPIGGAQLQLPLVSNKEISTNDQAQKGEREKILQEKAKKEAAQKKDAAQEKEVALAAVAIAKQQKKAEIKENIRGSPGIRLTVDLPIGGAQLQLPLVSNKEISTNDQAQKGEREKILQEKAKKEAAQKKDATQEKEVALATVAIAKQQKKAEIKENIRGSPGIRLTVDLPIGGAQLQLPLVSNKEISTNDQAQKGEREKILQEKAKKEAAQKKDAAQEKEVALAAVAIAKQQKKEEIKENIRGSPGIRLTVDLPIGGAQLQLPLVSNKEISTNDQAQKGEREKILQEKAKKEAAQKKDAAQEKEVALAAVAIAKQQKKAEIKENIRGSPGIRLTVDLPIGGAQLQLPLVSNKEISTNDQAQKGEREKILQEKAKKEAAQKKDATQEKEVALATVAIAKQQKKAEIKENIRGSPGIRLTVDLPIGGAQLQLPLVSNKEISTNDQAQKGEREKILQEKAKKEAAQKKDATQEKEVALATVAIAKQQKKAEIEENIRIMAKRLRYVFGDGSRTYTPRKRLCDVFGEGSRKSGPIKTVNTTYNEKDQTSTQKDTLPPQTLYGNRVHSDQNSYYSRISPIRLTVDLPISSPMTTTPQGREVVVAVPVTLEEGVGDNIAIQQQQAKAGRAIRDDVVPVVNCRRPDLNFHPPEEDNEDYYS